MKTFDIACELPMAVTDRSSVASASSHPSATPLLLQSVEPSRFAPVLTLVLWTSCALVGALGLTLTYARPQPATLPPAPMTVEMLQVELTPESLPEVHPATSAVELTTTPPPPEAVVQPQLPPPIAVATPSPAIAFAVPVEGPTRIVDAAHASHARIEADNRATDTAVLPVQPLTFGQGAGRQPAPDYPLRAQREGQEGVVNVRFTVGENGRVAAAEAVNPSAWPLLNESAVRTIRNRWRFSPGNPRAYEVAIRFVLPGERP